MRITTFFTLFTILTGSLFAQAEKIIKLNPPDLSRGYSFMKTLSLRASDREFDTEKLKLQDLSDLLWAANGINRPESGKRTAPSAQNAQDIDVYIVMEQGVYLYDAKKNQLDLISEGDHRGLFQGRQKENVKPPVICVMVSDISKFKFGEDSLKHVWAAEDAGIVSQNISLFCASTGLSTRPRAGMDQKKLREILKLKDTQHLMLNNPVSYKKK